MDDGTNTENSMTTESTGEPTRVRNRRHHSPEARKRIGLALLRRKQSDDRRRNISDALTGRRLSDAHRAACSRGQLGRVVTDETRKKISVANAGRKLRPLTHRERVARSIAMMGRVFTESHRRNLSEAVIGLKVGFRWIVSLRTTRERHLPAEEAADLVATGGWDAGPGAEESPKNGLRKIGPAPLPRTR
jgi:hypothetical protein